MTAIRRICLLLVAVGAGLLFVRRESVRDTLPTKPKQPSGPAQPARDPS